MMMEDKTILLAKIVFAKRKMNTYLQLSIVVNVSGIIVIFVFCLKRDRTFKSNWGFQVPKKFHLF